MLCRMLTLKIPSSSASEPSPEKSPGASEVMPGMKPRMPTSRKTTPNSCAVVVSASRSTGMVRSTMKPPETSRLEQRGPVDDDNEQQADGSRERDRSPMPGEDRPGGGNGDRACGERCCRQCGHREPEQDIKRRMERRGGLSGLRERGPEHLRDRAWFVGCTTEVFAGGAVSVRLGGVIEIGAATAVLAPSTPESHTLGASRFALRVGLPPTIAKRMAPEGVVATYVPSRSGRRRCGR